MSAEYTMQEMKDLHREGKTLLYPRMVIKGCYDTDELVRLVSKHTTFNHGEVKGVIDLLASGMARMMAQGYSVRLDGIGLFSPALALRQGKEREEADGSGTRRNASSIKVGGINFRPDKALVSETNLNCRLSRARKDSSLHVSEYTPEERLALARKYLEGNPTLDVGTYARLTGLGRTTAGKELRRWVETPGSGIGAIGRKSHRLYVLRVEQG